MEKEYITFKEFMEQQYYKGGKLVSISSLPEKKLTDTEIESIWSSLTDIPVNEDECLDDDFFIWQKGSDKYEDVWRWFDQNHSKGVAYLVNDYEG